MLSLVQEKLKRGLLAVGMDLTPLEPTPDVESLEGQDPQAHAEGVLKRRIAALIDKVSSVVFSYVAQVLAPGLLLPFDSACKGRHFIRQYCHTCMQQVEFCWIPALPQDSRLYDGCPHHPNEVLEIQSSGRRMTHSLWHCRASLSDTS